MPTESGSMKFKLESWLKDKNYQNTRYRHEDWYRKCRTLESSFETTSEETNNQTSRSEAILECSLDAIVQMDIDSRITGWNGKAEKIFGWERGEAIGRSLDSLIIPEPLREAHRQGMKRYLKTGVGKVINKNIEITALRKDGSEFPVELLVSALVSDKVIEFNAYIRDITERKAAEEELKKAKLLAESAESLFTVVFQSSPVLLDIISLSDNRYMAVNDTWLKVTGYTREEVINRNEEELRIWAISDQYSSVLSRFRESFRVEGYEMSLRHKSGVTLNYLCSIAPVNLHDQECMLIARLDITDLNNARAQVIQSSKLASLGEMATSVAHELNQPLNVIRMAAGNMRWNISKGSPSPEYLNEKLDRIESQTARAAAIIDHMRMFGRKADEKPELLDPRQVVENALNLMGEQLRLEGIEIITTFPDTCSQILGHTIQLEQVILNLLTNAMYAVRQNEKESTILLAVNEDKSNVHITVQDSGGGIPNEVLPRIFEPFFTTKEIGRGTGLGLSISYGIVTDMEGSLSVESLEGGARFCITLPKKHKDSDLV
jgi:PAS domain S-box-containing protein